MVTKLKNNLTWQFGAVNLIFFGLFILAWHPINDYDTFFGLKIGEYVIQNHALPFKEVFSWSAQGRSWIPYEWLAQTWIYLLNLIGGFGAIQAHVAAALTIFCFLIFLIYRKVLQRGVALSLTMSLVTYGLVYEFFVSRPQVIAFTSFALTIYLIWSYLLRRKNWLIVTPVITYIWTNSHASFIFAPALFFSYAFFGYLYLRSKKDPEALPAAKRLALFGLLNLAATLLPPLWAGGYQLLWNFWQDLAFISQAVTEWNGLDMQPSYGIVYSLTVTLTLIFLTWRTLRTPALRSRWLLTIPLLVIAVFSFSALRHIPFGTMSCLLAISLFIPEDYSQWRSRTKKLAIGLLAVVLLTTGYLIYIKREALYDIDWQFPRQSVAFVQTHHLNGRMLNEAGAGGYLTYYLYPQYQVFYDGRADVFHCCEMRDYWKLIENKHNTPEEFGKAAQIFLDKYQFSFAILANAVTSNEVNTATLLYNYLLDSPQWVTIFIGDHVQVLVRRDGKNDQLIRDYGMTAVTPFRMQVYRTGMMDQALAEYQHQISVTDIGVVRAALGQIYLEKGQLEQAELQFKQAEVINSHFGSPQLGLARIAEARHNDSSAIRYFQEAISEEPSLGPPYVELGQLYLSLGQGQSAHSIWEQGLAQNIDLLSRQKIVQLEAANP